MKKLFIAILALMAACALSVLCSCGECEHIDEDGDKLCDKCGEGYDGGFSENAPCLHRDKDDDGLCDKCSEGYTDGQEESTAGLTFELNEDGGYTVTGIGDSTLSDINIGLYNGQPVTAIGSGAFEDCGQLKSVTVRDTVKIIDEDAFSWCENLKSVTLMGGELTTIADYAFHCCYSLEGIRIPDSVVTIGEHAFSSSERLSWVILGDGVTTVGRLAFFECTELTSVTVGSSVKSIGDRAFADSYKLVEVINRSILKISAGSEAYGEIAYYAKEVHSESSKIERSGDFLFYTFEGVSYLLSYVGDDKNISLPDGHNGKNYLIYVSAFEFNSRIESVDIPNSVVAIDDYAFHCCTNLKRVTVGSGVEYIAPMAFYNCEKLSAITVDAANSVYESTNGNLYTKGGETLLQYAIGKTDTSFTLPNGVVNIGDNAFAYCRPLESVKLKDGVKTVGNGAFANCFSLTSVTLTNSTESFGDEAFLACYSLNTFNFDGSMNEWDSITKGTAWDTYVESYRVICTEG